MNHLLLIFVGGGVGSVLRYLVGRMVSGSCQGSFPWGTFTANIIGCLLIGLITAAIARWHLTEEIRLLLVVGLCGGFTTFSTLSNETFLLLRQGLYLWSLAYAVLSLLSGLCSVALGFALGNLVWKTV